jgi:RNA polymerase sigma-70 factor, ECF subfamily
MRFEGHVAPLLPTLYRVAIQMTKNAADADDLVQETMVRAYRRFIAEPAEALSKAWFVRIMQNLWIDNYRRQQRRPTEFLTGDVGDLEFDTRYRQSSARDAVEAQLIGLPVEADVRNAVRSLPGELRRALYYAYVEGLPYKDIAQLESIPVGTVMSRLYRARRQLRKLLPQYTSAEYVDRRADDTDVA